jgi:hypothetical protein
VSTIYSKGELEIELYYPPSGEGMVSFSDSMGYDSGFCTIEDLPAVIEILEETYRGPTANQYELQVQVPKFENRVTLDMSKEDAQDLADLLGDTCGDILYKVYTALSGAGLPSRCMSDPKRVVVEGATGLMLLRVNGSKE